MEALSEAIKDKNENQQATEDIRPLTVDMDSARLSEVPRATIWEIIKAIIKDIRNPDRGAEKVDVNENRDLKDIVLTSTQDRTEQMEIQPELEPTIER